MKQQGIVEYFFGTGVTPITNTLVMTENGESQHLTFVLNSKPE